MEKSNRLEIRIPKRERNIVLRKYMDYPKFLSLITTKSLYFAKPEEFEDKIDSIFPEYKGIKTDKNYIFVVKEECRNIAQQYYQMILDNLSKTYINIPTREQIFIVFQAHLFPLFIKGLNKEDINEFQNINNTIFKIVDSYISNDIDTVIDLMTDCLFDRMNRCAIDTRLLNRRRALISCWHIGEYESDLMWKTYAKTDGIMIQTSFNNIKQLDYKKYLEDGASCVIDKVKYIDLISRDKERNLIKFGSSSKNPINSDILCHYFEKNKSFESENELRIVIAMDMKYMNDFIKEEKGEEIRITTPLCNFIDRIIVSPFAPNYYADTLKRTLINMKFNKLANKIEISEAKKTELALQL